MEAQIQMKIKKLYEDIKFKKKKVIDTDKKHIGASTRVGKLCKKEVKKKGSGGKNPVSSGAWSSLGI